MKKTFHLFNFLNIPVDINYTWFIIFALVIYTLARGFFPISSPGLSQPIYWIMALIAAVLLFTSLVLHEISHSYIAQSNNLPIKGITLFIFGGVAHMEKEPTQPDIEFKMAIAGPICSLLLAFLFWILTTIASNLQLPEAITAIFAYVFIINLIIAGFNLIPGFPLDGGRMLRAGLWYWLKDIKKATRIASNMGKGFAYILIGIGILSLLSGNLISGVWLIFMGIFLQEAADTSYKQIIMKKALTGYKIKNIMSHEVITVSPNITVKDLVEQYFFKYRHASFPVIKEDMVLGLVTLNDVKKVYKGKWENTFTKEIMDPIEESMTINGEADAIEALSKMASRKIGRLLVIQKERLVGIVSQRDITRLFEFKKDLES